MLYKLLLYLLMVPSKYHWYVEGAELYSVPRLL